MRDIKFRAWNHKAKQMCEVDELLWDDRGNCHPIHGGSYVIYDKDKDVLMQYTGLKDKNGKEIYEGDIVAGYKGAYSCDVKGVIKYGGMAFACVGETKDGEKWFDTVTNPSWPSYSGIEVIGNIYENPELLHKV